MLIKFQKNLLLIFGLLIIILLNLVGNPALAREFNSEIDFVEYIYHEYSIENFAVVYQNFVPELKAILTKEEYLKFQQENFSKYELEYKDIEVGSSSQINQQQIASEFTYTAEVSSNKPKFYAVEVKYLLEFNRFGRREKETDKKVYVQQTESGYQLFWDPEPILGESEAAEDE